MKCAHIFEWRPCILCNDKGEVWFSGRMVPCICDNVTTANHKLREEVAQLQEELRRLRGDDSVDVAIL